MSMASHRRRVLLLLASVTAVAAMALASGPVRRAIEDAASERLQRELSSRIGPAQLAEGVRLRWNGTLEAGPLQVAASRPELPPVLRVQSLAFRISLRALLSGRIDVRTIRLAGVHIEAGERGRELLALVEQVRARRARSSPAGGGTAPERSIEIEIFELTAAGRWNGDFSIGPADARLAYTSDGGERRVHAEWTLGAGRVTAAAALAEDSSPKVGLVIEDLPLKALPLKPLLARAGVSVDDGLLDGRIAGTTSRAELSLDARELVVSGRRLAAEPLGPMRVALEATVSRDEAARRVVLEPATLRLGEQRQFAVALQGELERDRAATFTLSAQVKDQPLQDIVEALPAALRPGDGADALDGSLTAGAVLTGPVQQRDEWKLTLDLSPAGLRRHAHGSARHPLNASFPYRPLVGDTRGRSIVVGPENPFWAPLAEIPAPMQRAVLLSEDAGFHGHHGFDLVSLGENLVAARHEGDVIRGGSTITQQLAKNLFLSREKTYARKVREALLTLVLESAVSKSRLLEIYFNIIEWGPDVYGIGEAAWHYFGKRPADLSIKEAVFLATIIPNPVKYHVYCSRGALTEVWQQRVDELLAKMRDTGDVTEEEFAEATAETLAFQHRPRGEALQEDGGQPVP